MVGALNKVSTAQVSCAVNAMSTHSREIISHVDYRMASAHSSFNANDLTSIIVIGLDLQEA